MYKPISRESLDIKGYRPRFTSYQPSEPETISSPYTIEESLEEPSEEIEEAEEITPIQNPIPNYSGRGYENFRRAYEASGVDPSKFNFFAKLAQKESGFDNYIQNRAGAPAYGYFQFMQGSSRGRS